MIPSKMPDLIAGTQRCLDHGSERSKKELSTYMTKGKLIIRTGVHCFVFTKRRMDLRANASSRSVMRIRFAIVRHQLVALTASANRQMLAEYPRWTRTLETLDRIFEGKVCEALAKLEVEGNPPAGDILQAIQAFRTERAPRLARFGVSHDR